MRWLLACLGVVLCTEARAAEPIRTLDLRSLFGAAPADLGARRAAYDTLVAAACLQGIVNRDAPRLYLFYVTSVVDGSIDTDQLWFDRMKDPAIGGTTVAGRSIETLSDIEAAIAAYPAAVKGLVVWDEKVPATVNAAFAAAAADDLIAVRYDPDPKSLHQRLLARGLKVAVSLVNADGSSRFLDKQGTAYVPDLARQTSQSAKADSYVWALEKYLKSGKLDGHELGWMLDAHWLSDPRDYSGAAQSTSQLQLSNRDFLVARRGMPFDLSPWSDVAATDDPGQPIGTDVAVLDEIVSAARAHAGRDVVTVRGFFAWQFKYTTFEGLSAGHEPVMGEWTSVKRISKLGAGLDADAPGVATMANASFFQHVPLDEVPTPQVRPTPEDLIGRGFLAGLAPNGGFEDYESSWTVHTTNHVVYTDAKSHDGLRFLECNTTAVGDDSQDNLYRDGAYSAHSTLRAFVRAPAGPVNGQLVLWALGGTTESAVTSFTAGPEWKEVRVSLDAKGAGHTGLRGQIYLKTAGANLDLDDVAFYAGNAADAPVEPATYALWFVGDYDAAAWTYAFTPVTWDKPGRGAVPFSWDFSGHVATRFPPFFRHALRTRTARDYFVGADSGPGYGNPSQMDAPTREIWANGGVADARHLDTSLGWVLDPLAPVDAAHLTATTPFFGDGILLTGSGPTGTNVDHAPVVALDNLGGTDVASATSWILGATPATPSTAEFKAFRAVLWKSDDLVAITRAMPVGRKIRFVDPYSFSALARLKFGERTTHRASYRDLVRTAAGVELTVHNDGFDTWRAGGANPYRVAFHLTDTPPRVRTLPSDAAAYPVRISLAADVPPGGEAKIVAALPPQKPGSHVLQADVVEEGVTWFETAGDIPLQVAYDVVAPAPDAGVDAGDDATVTPPIDAATTDATTPNGPDSPSDSSCGCRLAGVEKSEHWSSLLVLAILFRRKRR